MSLSKGMSTMDCLLPRADMTFSLQQALHEPALEYYTAHSKRVRRKRNRHSQLTTYPAAAGGLNVTRPLRPEGWTVRYEYKMACFAEFRGENEVALKYDSFHSKGSVSDWSLRHYQDSYEMLTIMFGSTAILPPRTKRWAEAKVLVDCINIKVRKYLVFLICIRLRAQSRLWNSISTTTNTP